mmetsp:Transcript_22348/g.60394  ORF Transcript_22348/g.60394 Transcript_22348/m.60394 type:complete len:225 (-) Transcript_22348:514-1188(-)
MRVDRLLVIARAGVSAGGAFPQRWWLDFNARAKSSGVTGAVASDPAPATAPARATTRLASTGTRLGHGPREPLLSSLSPEVGLPVPLDLASARGFVESLLPGHCLIAWQIAIRFCEVPLPRDVRPHLPRSPVAAANSGRSVLPAPRGGNGSSRPRSTWCQRVLQERGMDVAAHLNSEHAGLLCGMRALQPAAAPRTTVTNMRSSRRTFLFQQVGPDHAGDRVRG